MATYQLPNEELLWTEVAQFPGLFPVPSASGVEHNCSCGLECRSGACCCYFKDSEMSCSPGDAALEQRNDLLTLAEVSEQVSVTKVGSGSIMVMCFRVSLDRHCECSMGLCSQKRYSSAGVTSFERRKQSEQDSDQQSSGGESVPTCDCKAWLLSTFACLQMCVH